MVPEYEVFAFATPRVRRGGTSISSAAIRTTLQTAPPSSLLLLA
jgi:hypothetical protein